MKLIENANLNAFFPDGKALINMMDFFIPDRNYGFYERLVISEDTGLPVEKELTRLITDRQLAAQTLKNETEAALEDELSRNPAQVNKRRLKRFYYHKDLFSVSIPPMIDIKLKLRSVDTEKYTALFNVVVDRFDLSTSIFSRYTLTAGQKDSKWKQAQVQMVDDEIKYTQGFRNIVSQYTVDEAEFAFILLNDLENIVVEEVSRSRVGPLYFRGTKIPEGLEHIFSKHPDAFILSLPTDRASIHLQEDKNLDPLAVMYRDVLEPGARELRDRKAKQTGYHVFKDRKFVCTNGVLEDFRQFLKDRGAKCVVYGI
ncbi:MAG: hypothetical protein LWY06_19500 [Firmicutes bacterium]|nr:hypothetical protein [Bacillota bacterium]